MVLLVVEAQDDEPPIAVFLVQHLQVRSLRTAGASPGGPEVEHHHLPPQVSEADFYNLMAYLLSLKPSKPE